MTRPLTDLELGAIRERDARLEDHHIEPRSATADRRALLRHIDSHSQWVAKLPFKPPLRLSSTTHSSPNILDADGLVLMTMVYLPHAEKFVAFINASLPAPPVTAENQ